jgi:hypothetical protein
MVLQTRVRGCGDQLVPKLFVLSGTCAGRRVVFFLFLKLDMIMKSWVKTIYMYGLDLIDWIDNQ